MALADLSLEVAHIYLADLTPEKAVAAARATSLATASAVEAFTSRGKVVSTCVLIDDYFATSGEISPEEAAQLVVGACADEGLTIDHVVMEGACADTVERLLQRLRPEPSFGEGSQDEPPAKVGWLANGARSTSRQRPGVKMAGEAEEDDLEPTPQQFGRRQHSIFLDVEIFSGPQDNRLYSCPLLAAWWQLIRLGMLQDDRNDPVLPRRSWSRPSAPPLAAKRTLTAIDPVFLEVEHAVRSILRQCELPESWYAPLRDGPEQPGPMTHLDRIAYTFVPDQFFAGR